MTEGDVCVGAYKRTEVDPLTGSYRQVRAFV